MKTISALIIISCVLVFTAPAAMADGKAIFETKCKACHGIDAKGSESMSKGLKVELKALNLRDDTKEKAEADLVKVVTEGQSGKMPSFKGKLDDAQILEVVKYFKGL